MKRRTFISLLGGAAAAWPLAARAQQGERVRRIGVLSALREDDPESVARRAVFEQALQALGWTVGRDLRIDYRWTGTDPANIQKFAAELGALAPDVILASANIVIAPMLRAARTTPIVLTQAIDPVGSGFVRSMARPACGGQIQSSDDVRRMTPLTLEADLAGSRCDVSEVPLAAVSRCNKGGP
jgi:putative tryptophan/tyrosine transport system substrate-binding protein